MEIAETEDVSLESTLDALRVTNEELEATVEAARLELWRNHGHPFSALYADDGEMQCALCKLHDWKRNKLKDLIESLREQRQDVYRFDYEVALEKEGLRLKEELNDKQEKVLSAGDSLRSAK
jgi:hypothetical protein